VERSTRGLRGPRIAGCCRFHNASWCVLSYSSGIQRQQNSLNRCNCLLTYAEHVILTTVVPVLLTTGIVVSFML
jgi:hypothetical protein